MYGNDFMVVCVACSRAKYQSDKTLGDLLKEEKIAQGADNTYLAVHISGKLVKGVLAVAYYFCIWESKRVLSKLRELMYLLEAASSGYQSTVAIMPAGLLQRAWIH